MAIKHIVISYDDAQMGADGESFDLLTYLENELDNLGIVAQMLESPYGLAHAADDFRECYEDHS